MFSRVYGAFVLLFLAFPGYSATVDARHQQRVVEAPQFWGMGFPDMQLVVEGLQWLDMPSDVEVIRLEEYAHLDSEPLYLARSGDREVVFRAGDDLCMRKVGEFVACNMLLDRELSALNLVADDEPVFEVEDLQPGMPKLVTVTPGSRPSVVSGNRIPSGGGSFLPDPSKPAPVRPPEDIPSAPLPASLWLLVSALGTVSLVKKRRKVRKLAVREAPRG